MGILLLGVIASVTGCAYYNLFYNAEEALEEAEKLGREVDPREQPTQQQRTQYLRAIGKAQLLLEEYPDSGLVDDALFVIGKCHLRIGEFTDALRSLDNLLANFPQSEFVEEAMYLKGRAHLGLGEEQTGLDWFARLREAFPEGRFAAEALFRLADAYVEEGRTSQAIEVYRQFLETYPKSSETSRVRVSLARTLIDEDRLPEAIDELDLLVPEDLNDVQRFQARRLQIESLLAADRAEEAVDLVESLPDLAGDAEQRGEARLLRGRVLLQRGLVEEGTEVLRNLAESQVGTELAGEAWFTIVQYFALEEGPESERLDEVFEDLVDVKVGRLFGQQVREIEDDVARYDTLVATASEVDSTSTSDRAAAALDLGELLLFDFESGERALVWYEQAFELGRDTDVGPRAAYAIGWIHDEVLDDPDEAAVAYERLRTLYPESVQARALEGEQFLEPKERTREELEALAEARIRAAGAGTDAQAGGGDPNDPRFAPMRSLRLGGPGAFTPRSREGT